MTGGAGLVGSAFCRELLTRGASVLCVDNLTLGTRRHVAECAARREFELETWDVSDKGWYDRLRGRAFDLLIHLASNSDISASHQAPEIDYQRTLATTFEALQASRKLSIKDFIFSSSSAVYGAHPPLPTPEDAAGLYPVSIYGAGKLASEAFISAFVENYGLNAWVFRFGNVVGERLTHGVIYDFVRKLRANPHALRVLGDGHQTKTYIDVDDCVGGMLHAWEHSPPRGGHESRYQIFNLSTDGVTSVRDIAQACVTALRATSCQIEYGDQAVGWVGDVPRTALETSRMKALGWKPRLDSTVAVTTAIRTHHEWVCGEK